VLCFSYVQEQTQIIAIAIGKAIPMALPLVSPGPAGCQVPVAAQNESTPVSESPAERPS
jgi:hypothetical protein